MELSRPVRLLYPFRRTLARTQELWIHFAVSCAPSLPSLSFLRERMRSLRRVETWWALRVICFKSFVHPQLGHHFLSYFLPGSWRHRCVGTEANEKLCSYRGLKKNHTSFILAVSQLSWMLQEFKVKEKNRPVNCLVSQLGTWPIPERMVSFLWSQHKAWWLGSPLANRHRTPM